MEFVTHARTPEELRAEVCSDLYRRIASLDAYSKAVAKGAEERSRIARAITELKDMLEFWRAMRIERPKTKRELDREAKQKGISVRDSLSHIPNSLKELPKEPH